MIEAHKWSNKFRELWNNDERSLDINEYDTCLIEWSKVHEKKMYRYYVLTIIFFVGGMWAVYEHAIFLAVLLLSLAANFNRQSSHHILITEFMNVQRMLAMLVNKQSLEVKENIAS